MQLTVKQVVDLVADPKFKAKLRDLEVDVERKAGLLAAYQDEMRGAQVVAAHIAQQDRGALLGRADKAYKAAKAAIDSPVDQRVREAVVEVLDNLLGAWALQSNADRIRQIQGELDRVSAEFAAAQGAHETAIAEAARQLGVELPSAAV